MFKGRSRKELAWIIPRILILGPLVILIVLGQWAEEAFEFLNDNMPKEHNHD